MSSARIQTFEHETTIKTGAWAQYDDTKTKPISAFCFLLSASSLSAFTAHAQLSYVTNNGTITITGGCPSSPGNVTIPETINGLPVTSIGSHAFSDCASLTSITLPNSLTTIDYSAFSGCTSLTSITIPNNVTHIGDGTFWGCSSLTAIEADPANPTYSSLNGVLFNKIQTLLIVFPGGKAGVYTIPNSVSTIGYSAFHSCTSLMSLTIPNSVTEIGIYAFAYSTSLTNVVIGDGVTTIRDGAFATCTSLTSITIPNSVTNMGFYSFGGCTSLTKLVMSSALTDIASYAFEGCTSLTSFTIPNIVTNIGSEAFAYCTSLTDAVIPNSVTTIGYGAFEGCTSLRSAYFQGNAPSAAMDVFAETDNVTVYYLPGTTGWGAAYADKPTTLWTNPLLSAGSVGVSANGFAFSISWAPNSTFVVEASSDLANPAWSSIATNTASSGSWQFSDPNWMNYPTRFYRVRSP